MKRGRRYYKKKFHDTLIGMQDFANKAAHHRGHKIEWREEKLCEAIAVCTSCNAVAVVVMRPLGIENVIVGNAVNKECPNRQEEKIS